MNTHLEAYILALRNDTAYCIVDVFLALKGRLEDYTFPGIIMTMIIQKTNCLAGLQFLNLSSKLLHGKIPQNIVNTGTLVTKRALVKQQTLLWL